MSYEPIDKATALQNLPPAWPRDPLPAIGELLAAARRKVVVVDDDPTGTQTVWGVPVLTGWSVAALAEELRNELPACYLLTNSRGMPPAQAEAINAEIGRNILDAAQETGRDYAVISRSDSTLRGHFPGEVDALAAALGGCDATLLVPAFFDGGRFTLDDVHYVTEGEWLVPAGRTAFARDAAFGYRASNLRAWVEEKTAGRVAAAAVHSLSLDDLRRGGPERVHERLLALPRGGVGIVNAAAQRDLEVFTLGLLRAEAEGRRFLLRSAASIVPLRAGIPARPLLTAGELELPERGGGLVVVGSYVPTTSEQLRLLLEQPQVASVEIDVAALLDDRRDGEIARVVGEAERRLRAEADVVLWTSRDLVTGPDAGRSLAIGAAVSASLVAIVRALDVRPRYLLAKGGITSSDVATAGLGVARAMIAGQLLPGVPVWKLGSESRYPDLTYIVFPGNVGGPRALAEVVGLLGRHEETHPR